MIYTIENKNKNKHTWRRRHGEFPDALRKYSVEGSSVCTVSNVQLYGVFLDVSQWLWHTVPQGQALRPKNNDISKAVKLSRLGLRLTKKKMLLPYLLAPLLKSKGIKQTQLLKGMEDMICFAVNIMVLRVFARRGNGRSSFSANKLLLGAARYGGGGHTQQGHSFTAENLPRA